MQEELKGQLAEASGFGELPQLFAEAYQIQSGGNLTGAEARAALMKAMEDGQVKSNIIPLVAKLMDELSKGGIEKARTSSIAEQERFNNSMTRLLELFSKSGGEAGFAKFWRLMNDGASSATPLVRGLTESFQNLVTFMEAPISLFKDFNKVLAETSKISGISEGNLTSLALVGGLMMTKWGQVAVAFAAILLTLQDISYGLQGKDSYTRDFMRFAGIGPEVSGLEERMKGGDFEAAKQLARIRSQDIKTSEMGVTMEALRLMGHDPFASEEKVRAIMDKESPFYNSPQDWDASQADAMEKAARLGGYSADNSVSINGGIHVTFTSPANASDEDNGQSVADIIVQKIQEAMSAFGHR